MNNAVDFARPAGAPVGQNERIKKAVLGIIADIWRCHPSKVPLPRIGTDDQGLFDRVLGLLAQEGLVLVAGNVLSLTESGYDAVHQASRGNGRVMDLLRGRALPDEECGSSILVLAILHTQFERRMQQVGRFRAARVFLGHHAAGAGPGTVSGPKHCAS